MSDGRKRLSGAEYKRRAKEKNEKEKEEIEKMRKLKTFFDSSKKSDSVMVERENMLTSNSDHVDRQCADFSIANVSTISKPANIYTECEYGIFVY